MLKTAQEPLRAPGVTFAVKPNVPAPTLLRTDVAGVIARTARGPINSAPMRVAGRREFEAVFGELSNDNDGLAIRGYFENGGELLWVVRVAGNQDGSETKASAAFLNVEKSKGYLGSLSPEPGESGKTGKQRFAKILKITARTPGNWSAGLQVVLNLRKGGTPAGLFAPDSCMADLLLLGKGQIREHLLGLDPKQIVEQINDRSSFIKLEIAEERETIETLAYREIEFSTTLNNGSTAKPTVDDYRAAAFSLIEEPEPAILFAPSVWNDLNDQALSFYSQWMGDAFATIDRLIIVDPCPDGDAQKLKKFADDLRKSRPDLSPWWVCTGSIFCPRIRVPNPHGSPMQPTLAVTPSGHIAGLMSRLDRERGAYYTPANVPITGAVDLTFAYDNAERAALTQYGLNTLRCSRNRGVEVWGGRTLDLKPLRRFIAHRRLIHRLVRAIHAVAEPLVFDSNTPIMRLMFVRSITTVLLEAYRAGALKGSRPEEAFQVRCDDQTNPPNAYETGFCMAEVDIAPAAPMEFIHLVISLSQDGSLQVLE